MNLNLNFAFYSLETTLELTERDRTIFNYENENMQKRKELADISNNIPTMPAMKYGYLLINFGS